LPGANRSGPTLSHECSPPAMPESLPPFVSAVTAGRPRQHSPPNQLLSRAALDSIAALSARKQGKSAAGRCESRPGRPAGLGAVPMDEWTAYRLTGDALLHAAGGREGP